MMTTKIFEAFYGDYNDYTNWSTGRLPAQGDLAEISSGFANIYYDTSINYTLDVGSPLATAQAQLTGINANITNNGLLATGSVDGSNPDAIYTGTIYIVNGSLVNNGWMAAVGAHSQMNVELSFAPLANYGLISAEGPGSTVRIAAASPILMNQPAAVVYNNHIMQANGGTLDFAASVTGQGTINVVNGGRAVVETSLGRGQYVNLTSGMLEVTDPARMSFLGSVGGLTAASTFQVDGGWADTGPRSLAITSISRAGETLSLEENGAILFSVPLAGHYSLDRFSLAQQGTSAMIGYDHSPPVMPTPGI